MDATYLNSYLNAGVPGSKRNLTKRFEQGTLRQLDHHEMVILNSMIPLNRVHQISFGVSSQFQKLIYNKNSIYQKLSS